MTTAFQYRPRFTDIRVRPPKAEPDFEVNAEAAPEPGWRACDHAGCRAPAVARAPKDRRLPHDHYWFCQSHAAQYNRGWNFFAGMSEREMRARLAEEQATGGRPTWSMRGGGRNREAAGLRGAFRDVHGHFATGAGPGDSNTADPRLGKLERTALADLDLVSGATGAAIRARYIELVKRCHPDANGGDRSAEHKLQRVIRAYKTLRKARLA